MLTTHEPASTVTPGPTTSQGVVEEIEWHGRHLAVRQAGAGPVVVLVHGMAGSLGTWDPAFDALAREFHVIALDLPGHGASSRFRGDYSLGSLASSVRDVLDALGVGRATIVGHSLGGGVAMQFLYQFPERCERLVLVSSGGLGREVTPVLRALSVPGAALVLAGLATLHRQRLLVAAARLARPVGSRLVNDLPYMLREMASLAEPETRRSFLGTIDAVIDVRGQRVSALERLHLAAGLPTLIVWGDKDPIIPSEHGRAATALIPGSRFELMSDAGHYPHEDHPEVFAELVGDFIAHTRARA